MIILKLCLFNFEYVLINNLLILIYNFNMPKSSVDLGCFLLFYFMFLTFFGISKVFSSFYLSPFVVAEDLFRLLVIFFTDTNCKI